MVGGRNERMFERTYPTSLMDCLRKWYGGIKEPFASNVEIFWKKYNKTHLDTHARVLFNDKWRSSNSPDGTCSLTYSNVSCAYSTTELFTKL